MSKMLVIFYLVQNEDAISLNRATQFLIFLASCESSSSADVLVLSQCDPQLVGGSPRVPSKSQHINFCTFQMNLIWPNYSHHDQDEADSFPGINLPINQFHKVKVKIKSNILTKQSPFSICFFHLTKHYYLSKGTFQANKHSFQKYDLV